MGWLVKWALTALAGSFFIVGIACAGVATEVVVNKSVLLNLKEPTERVSIASPAIAELVVISPTELQLIGKKVGTTSLIVWGKGGKTSFFDVRVKGDTALLEEQIREIAPNDSITVEYANDTIILRGKASNTITVAKAVKLAQAYIGKIAEDQAYKDEKQGIPQMLNQATNHSAYGNGISVLGGYNSAYTEVNNLYDASLGSEKMILPEEKVLNYIEVDDPQQVLLEVKVAQIDKSAMKDLGLSVLLKGASAEGFSNLVGAPTQDIIKQGIITPGIAANTNNLGSINPSPYQLGASFFNAGVGVVLKALVSKDLAKILAEPNLLVKSGQEGRFHAGTKYPIPVLVSVNGVATTSILWEEVGVKVTFRPRVQENGLIALKIDPAEVSNIIGYTKNDYPIVDTRKTQTNVELKEGQSLVLAGLLNEETRKAISKVPLLGDIPIIGFLFRSTHDEVRERELVFFITPKLVKPNAAGTKMELPTDRPLTPEQEKEFKWVPSPE